MPSGPQDQPDGVRLLQVVPFIVVPPTITPLPNAAVVTVGPFYVGNLPALYAAIVTANDPQLCQVDVLFSNDGTVGATTYTHRMLCDNGHFIDDYIPVVGNFVLFQISALGGGVAGLQMLWNVNGAAAGLRSISFANVTTLASNTDPLAGGAASAAHGLLVTLPGPWRIFVASGGVGVGYNVQAQLANGVWTIIAQAGNVAATQVAEVVYLPPCPIRYQVANTNAAAQTLLSSLVPAS